MRHCAGFGKGLNDAVKSDEDGRVMSRFSYGRLQADALYPGFQSAATIKRLQTMALALSDSGADCFKHPEVLSALGDRMLKHLLKSRFLYSPA